MAYVGKVHVKRRSFSDDYEGTITFLTNMGPQPKFKIETSRVIGGAAIGMR